LDQAKKEQNEMKITEIEWQVIHISGFALSHIAQTKLSFGQAKEK
jgi:hypothetical protein